MAQVYDLRGHESTGRVDTQLRMSSSASVHYVLPEYLAARRAAQRRDWRVLVLSVTTGMACLIGAGFVLGPINRIRQERQLGLDQTSVRGLPPALELASKLGPIRALAIDVAFIRYERLKEQGKNYEAYQLAQILTSLQPRFPGVWAYNSWNMAYNISVAYYAPEARWKWVTNGIRELRDKGLQYNPREITLYKDLAYIYWHKIADFLDDEHLSYKRALAVEMERVLGEPPVMLSAEEEAALFKKIADAPQDWGAFLQSDPEAAAFVARLTDKEDIGLSPDRVLLDFVARHLRRQRRLFEVAAAKPEADEQFQKRLAFLTDPAHEAALHRVLAVIRSRVLREEMRLDPQWMLKLMEEFGPVDWRAAWAHALYWSSYGDMKTEGRFNLNPNDSMNTVRFIFFALRYGETRGRLIFVPNFDKPFDSYIDFRPDTRFIPYTFAAYLKYGEKQFKDDPRFEEGTAGPQYRSGFFNWIEDSIGNLFREGGESNLKLAQEFLDYLREHNRHPNGGIQDRYVLPLRDFVFGNLKEEMMTYKQSDVIVRGFMDSALDKLGGGDVAGFEGDMDAARTCYDHYMAEMTSDVKDRRRLQAYELMFAEEALGYFQDARRHVLMKKWLWDRVDLRLQQMIWDEAQPYLVKICELNDPPLDAAKMFPEPPGMEEFRKDEVYQRFRRNPTVEEGERK